MPPAPPADAMPPAPPADVPPAPPADVPPPADVLPPAPDAPPAPADVNGPPAAPQQASKVGYTQKLWDAIRGEDVNGNDALDSLAQPAPVN
jgi:hypothetical protein